MASAALAAGFPEEQIQKLGRLLQRPNRMTEPARGMAGKGRSNVLSESEDELDVEAEEEGEKPSSSGGGVEKAVVQLTKIMAKITKSKRSKDGLEGILDRVDAGGTGFEGGVSSSTGGRSKAAAYTAQASFLDQSIHRTADVRRFQLFPSAARSFSSGDNESSMGGAQEQDRTLYATTIRAAWMISGIHDALRSGDSEQARARCCLALAALDQGAVDSGNCSSFNVRKGLEVGEQQLPGGDGVETEGPRQFPRKQEEIGSRRKRKRRSRPSGESRRAAKSKRQSEGKEQGPDEPCRELNYMKEVQRLLRQGLGKSLEQGPLQNLGYLFFNSFEVADWDACFSPFYTSSPRI